MVKYENAIIVSLGKPDHTVGESGTVLLPTTQTRAYFLADTRRKYREYINGKGKEQPFYELIKSIGVDNLTALVVDKIPCDSKDEMNILFNKFVTQVRQPAKLNIEQNKADIKPITLTRYEDNLNVLKKRMKTTNPLFYNDTKNVLDYIENVSGWAKETQKNYLKALVAFIPDGVATKKIYQAALMRIGGETQEIRDKNEMSFNQSEKWVSYDLLLKRYYELKSKGLSKDFIVASFYSGVYFAPYRVKELLYLKWKNCDTKTDNYIDFAKKVIVLNIYKTDQDYGRREQKIPAEFLKMLASYVKTLKGDYLIENENGGQSSYYELNKIIQSVYSVGASLIRNIYVSHLYEIGKLKTNTQMKKIAGEMRNSIEQMLQYRKILKEA